MKYAKLCIIFVGIFAIFGGYIAWKISTVPLLAVHYHANFLVYKDGAIQDYSDNKYTELEPCTLDEHRGLFEKEERVHLHNNIGSVAHVHAPGVKWGELFVILRIDGRGATYVANGSDVVGLEKQDIHSQDRVLVILGAQPKNIDDLFAQVPSDAVEYNAGSKGVESCSTKKDETYSLWQRFRIAFGM